MNSLLDFLNLDEDNATSEVTYFTCLKVLSEGIAKLPLDLQEVSDTKAILRLIESIEKAVECDIIYKKPVFGDGHRIVDNTSEGGAGGSGGGSSDTAHDSSGGNITITDEAIANVPKTNIFDDDEKNERYCQANKDLLKEAQKYPVGTEVSRVYDADMKPIVVRDDEGKIVREYGYTVGGMGSVRIDDPGVPYHAFHNHPSGESLGSEDLLQLAIRDNQLSITAQGNNANNFCMLRNNNSDSCGYATFLINKMDSKTFCKGRYSYKEIKEFDISELSDDLKDDIVQQLKQFNQECIKGGEKYGFTYIESKTG